MAERSELPENEKKTLAEELVMPALTISKSDKRDILFSFLPVVIVEALLSAAMVAVYISLKRFTSAVLYGALLGTGLELINFLIMVISVVRAEKSETPMKGQIKVKSAYMVRMIVLLIVLVIALKTGYFEPLATLLPFCFMRIALFSSQIFYKMLLKKRKKGEKA